MLRSEAAKYARWSAIVAVVLAAVTILAYVRRDWVRHIEKKNAPPAAPIDVSRQSAGLNFKKVELKQTIFEVAASKSTEFKGQDASLLEDVRITIYGKAGDRHDVIHTRSCRYGKENGAIECSGDVQIDLMSAADAHRDTRRAIRSHDWTGANRSEGDFCIPERKRRSRRPGVQIRGRNRTFAARREVHLEAECPERPHLKAIYFASASSRRSARKRLEPRFRARLAFAAPFWTGASGDGDGAAERRRDQFVAR
jgi:hypothetical protein